MIRVTGSCKGLRGWKLVVNGHLLTTIRVGSLVTVSHHDAWAWSRGKRMGGLLTGESACRRGGGGWSPEVGSQILSPHQPTGIRCPTKCTGWPQEPGYFLSCNWSLLPSKSKRLQRLLLPTSLLTLMPCLELTIVIHQPLAQAPQHGSVHCCTPTQGRGAILDLSTLLDRGARLCKYKLFFLSVMHPG